MRCVARPLVSARSAVEVWIRSVSPVLFRRRRGAPPNDARLARSRSYVRRPRPLHDALAPLHSWKMQRRDPGAAPSAAVLARSLSSPAPRPRSPFNRRAGLSRTMPRADEGRTGNIRSPCARRRPVFSSVVVSLIFVSVPFASPPYPLTHASRLSPRTRRAQAMERRVAATTSAG